MSKSSTVAQLNKRAFFTHYRRSLVAPWAALCLMGAFSTNAAAADVRGAAIVQGSSFSGFPDYPNPNLGTTDFFASGSGALVTQTTREDFQRIIPISDTNLNPRLGLLAQAIVSGRIGTLAGYASAEAKGSSVPSISGVTAFALVQAFDTFEVRSGSLQLGTPVELDFELNIEGNGTFFADFNIQRSTGSGPGKGLDLQLSGFGFNGIGGTQRGTISAVVGERYRMFYGLKVAATVSTSGMTGETRFNVSDYSNTGHYYAQARNDAVFLQTGSGYDYSLPAPVPLPMSVFMLAPALGILVRWRRASARHQ